MTTDIEGCSGDGDAGEAHVSQVGRCRQHVAEDNDGSGSLAEMAETTRPGSDEDDAVDDADAERRCSDDSMQGLAPHRGMLECDQTGCAHGCTDEALCVSVSACCWRGAMIWRPHMGALCLTGLTTTLPRLALPSRPTGLWLGPGRRRPCEPGPANAAGPAAGPPRGGALRLGRPVASGQAKHALELAGLRVHLHLLRGGLPWAALGQVQGGSQPIVPLACLRPSVDSALAT